MVDELVATIVDEDEDEDVLPPGTLLGKYEIQGKKKDGGMGRVYVAYDASLRRVVAIKTLLRDFRTPDFIGRFKREANQLAKLDHHPNIVRVLEFVEDSSLVGPYLVMEYLRGKDLRELVIERRQLEVPLAVEIQQGVCCGVRACHRWGLIHRDLNPGNVFVLQNDGQVAVKVVDFGVSKPRRHDALAEKTRAGQMIGTREYMAPEQIDGESTELTDQYSIGVMLYLSLTGRLPFRPRQEFSELAEQIRAGAFAPPRAIRPEIPADLESVVLRAMARDPRDRFRDVRELGAGLAGLAVMRGRRGQAAWSESFSAPDQEPQLFNMPWSLANGPDGRDSSKAPGGERQESSGQPADAGVGQTRFAGGDSPRAKGDLGAEQARTLGVGTLSGVDDAGGGGTIGNVVREQLRDFTAAVTAPRRALGAAPRRDSGEEEVVAVLEEPPRSPRRGVMVVVLGAAALMGVGGTAWWALLRTKRPQEFVVEHVGSGSGSSIATGGESGGVWPPAPQVRPLVQELPKEPSVEAMDDQPITPTVPTRGRSSLGGFRGTEPLQPLPRRNQVAIRPEQAASETVRSAFHGARPHHRPQPAPSSRGGAGSDGSAVNDSSEEQGHRVSKIPE